MRSAQSSGFMAILGALGVLVIASGARANNLNHSGTICRSYYASQVADIEPYNDGVENSNANSRYIICPIVHWPTTDGSQTLYIDGWHGISETTSCTVYSYNYNGTMLASQSFSVTKTGYWEQSVFFAASTVPAWANLSVVCLIPGNLGAAILDVDLVEP